MANKYWEPKALSAAQVGTITITYDAATTYTLTVGGVDLVSEVGVTDATTTATNMITAWNLLTHPYASGITAGSAAAVITFTADVAEVPFTVSGSVAGGTGTIGSYTATTAATGPHTLDNPINWSGEAVPANSDVIYFKDSAIVVAWGLAGLTTTGHTLIVEQTYTGKIGLDRAGVATSADGQTTDTGAPEYRATYMQIECAVLDIGVHDGTGDPGGSGRLKIDNDRAAASETTVHRTGAAGSEIGKPPVQLLAANASANVNVRSGLVGIGVSAPGETSTVGNVNIQRGGVFLGDGVTVTNITQHEGSSVVNIGAATLTKLLVHGGTITVNGDQAITTIEVTGGAVICNTTGTITTVTHQGGEIDYTQSPAARTVTTHQLYRGATVRTDDDVVTITNLLEPDGPSVISVS